MLWQQRMTPVADPQQAKMMMLTPVMFLFFFLWAPSGLVIYWLVSNLLGIGQQYATNRIIGRARREARRARRPNGGSSSAGIGRHRERARQGIVDTMTTTDVKTQI